MFDSKTYLLRIARATTQQETAEAVMAAIEAATTEPATKSDLREGFAELRNVIVEQGAALQIEFTREMRGLFKHIYGGALAAALLIVGGGVTVAHWLK
jgi:hypothetical protein